tara:strand:+ start:348 stop:512 length:165 start_codon:yes stop_codon:yes gene_type:complete
MNTSQNRVAVDDLMKWKHISKIEEMDDDMIKDASGGYVSFVFSKLTGQEAHLFR